MSKSSLPPGGVLCGLLAAALFGASAPVAKLLLPSAGPLLLAGLLYVSAGLCLTAFRLLQALRPRRAASREAPLRRADYFLLSLIVIFGGILGPLLMLWGLARTAGVTAALLLNMEAPLTMLVAVSLFGEQLGRRESVSALLICCGAALLSYRPEQSLTGPGGLLGAAALVAACLCWAVDNNLTQRLSLRDPIALVHYKTLLAGSCNLGLAILLGHAQGISHLFPGPKTLAVTLALGALSYGLSVVLDAYALRILGAAREAPLFATAPFVGALLALPLLGEHLRGQDGAAAMLMIAGVAVLLRARHSHVHTHETMEHEHSHLHDEHHQHEHSDGLTALPDQPHSHPHRHAPLTHDHPHVSDLHHRHAHD
jgi:drug/metabolite transporter (DMT)-like permease